MTTTELRLYVVALLAGVYAISWRALATPAPAPTPAPRIVWQVASPASPVVRQATQLLRAPDRPVRRIRTRSS